MRLAILAFAAGVLLLQLQPDLPAWSPWLSGAAVASAVSALVHGVPRRGLTLVACGLLGFAWAAWRAEVRLADRLDPAWEGRDVEVVGVVAGLPQALARGVRFEFAVETVSTAGAVLPGRVQLAWYGTDPDALRPGQRWRFVVRLKRPHGGANPGGFDYEAWLLERGIRATGYVRPAPAMRLDPLVVHPAWLVERLRDEVRRSFERRLPAETHPWAGILIALTIGDQKAVDGDLWAIFNRTGTTHLMSISGLHVTLVAALFGRLLAAVWRRVPRLALRLPAQQAGLCAAALAAAGYALFAGFAVPAQRTLYMLLVAAAAMLSGRLLAPGRILAAALLAVLLADPWAVLAPGFWLSFGAVGALLYVGAARLGGGAGWRARLADWGLVQWAATLASLPVLLLVFQQFSLVSPLANALAVPVISLLVTPLALLGAVLPGPWLLMLDHALLDLLMRFLIWCSGWPVWQAAAPPWWAALAAAAGVALCLLPRGLPGRALGLVLLLPAAAWPVVRPPPGVAWISVLDVGQGLAAVIRSGDRVAVYDPGPAYGPDADAGQRIVVPYLRWLGIDRVDLLILSHRDADHAGGAASLRAALPVGETLAWPPEPGEQPCLAGRRLDWAGVGLHVLHPATPGRRGNHDACVVAVEAGGRRMLLTSDIEAADEADLLRRAAAQLKADVLLVPHHGSLTSSSPAFVAAVGAADALVSAGYRNRFGHPRPEVVARYEGGGARLWRTDRDGALLVELAPGGATVSAWREQRRRYWHSR